MIMDGKYESVDTCTRYHSEEENADHRRVGVRFCAMLLLVGVSNVGIAGFSSIVRNDLGAE
jgi:hypothetical protein